MNGNARLGILFALMSGSFTSQGAESIDSWQGLVALVIGLAMGVASFDQVDKGIKESIRLNELEKAAKTRR
ncbi:hypothetical protein SEA_SHAM_226 [Streptomyces phage Sham]|nr:hypothetical protein SEA_SHAM_226 [Streptomyces phage Sham]